MAPKGDTIMARWLLHDRGDLRKLAVYAWCAVVLWLTSVSGAASPRVQLGIQDGPYYVGEPIVVQVRAKDFDGEPRPVCEPGKIPKGLGLIPIGVPSISRQVRIEGQTKVYEQVDLTFNFQAVAQKAGAYRVPPFTIRQNNRSIATKALDLHVQEIETHRDMRIALDIPAGPHYPGQRVPVTIEWWYAGDIKTVNTQILYNKLSIRSQLFDQFKFIDEKSARGESTLPIVAGNQVIGLKANAATRTLDGQQFLVVSARRLMLVEIPGQFELMPITASVPKVTRWRRDFFGGLEPAVTIRLRAIGQPQTLTIEPLPLDQAPPSFAGALGHGFSLDVNADRSVVQVGDPIELTVIVRGDGNLQTAGLPPLSAQADPDAVSAGGTVVGLDPIQFRLPDQDVAGIVAEDGKSKKFVVTVRVLNDSVAQIPSIAYSWFEPTEQTFVTTYSGPIALQVRPAQMVGAADVVVADSDQNATRSVSVEDNSTLQRNQPDVVAGGRRLNLTDADLTIQKETQCLLVDDSNRFGGVTVRGMIYVVSVLMVVAAWGWRRVAEVDPELTRRRQLIQQQVKQITKALSLPRQQAASQITMAMRHLVAVSNGTTRGQIDQLLADCDIVAFAPTADDGQRIDAALHERAVVIARSIAKEGA